MNPVLVENPIYNTRDTRDTRDTFDTDTTYYPEEDGEPMAETERHLRSTFYAVGSLDNFFEDDPMMYICGNMFIYLEEGNPHNVVSPEVFAVPGISKHERRVYKLWIEKKPPAFVLEIISRSTAKQDEGEKRDIYQAIGVHELFLHDPDEDYMKPGLAGWRLNQHGMYIHNGESCPFEFEVSEYYSQPSSKKPRNFDILQAAIERERDKHPDMAGVLNDLLRYLGFSNFARVKNEVLEEKFPYRGTIPESKSFGATKYLSDKTNPVGAALYLLITTEASAENKKLLDAVVAAMQRHPKFADIVPVIDEWGA